MLICSSLHIIIKSALPSRVRLTAYQFFDLAIFLRDLQNYLVVVVVGTLWYHFNMVGPIEKIPMQANLYSHTGSSIKIPVGPGSGFLYSP